MNRDPSMKGPTVDVFTLALWTAAICFGGTFLCLFVLITATAFSNDNA